MWFQRMLRRPLRLANSWRGYSSGGRDSRRRGFAMLSALAGSVGTLSYQVLAGEGYCRSLWGQEPSQIPNLDDLALLEFGSSYLTDEDVDKRLNEFAYSYSDCTRAVKYAGAQLGSNPVCEDAYIHGKITNPLKTVDGGDWLVWGVFDGHNGPHTSQLIAKQLLPHVRQALQRLQPNDGVISDSQIHEAVVSAFETLDDHIIESAKDVIESDRSYSEKVEKLKPAYAGSCALLTLYDPSSGKLHVASTGDSRAVLGFKTADGTWEAEALTKDQTGTSANEIARLKARFPGEPNIFLRPGRVYGMQPSRSFGDGVYKWNSELRERLRAEFNAFKQPHESSFPGFGDGPYLTALPMVRTVLVPQDSFLVLATDGLWDTMGNQNAVDLVSRLVKQWERPAAAMQEARSDEVSLEPIKFGRSGCWYSDYRATYRDSNVAVHLIRNALGGRHDEMVRGALTFPFPLSRYIRDDITVQVIFFSAQ